MPKTIPLLLLLLSASTSAHASGGSEPAAPINSTWKTECSSCHIAYPARMLPAASWKRLMGSLDKHFGTDASLDPAATTEILAYLEKNASRRKVEPAAQPTLRITEMAWFVREHDEISNKTWKNPQVKSRSNCAACHTNAENGRFSEHEVRIPR